MYICCLATRLFIGNLPAAGRGWVVIELAGGQLPTNQLLDINWGALDHASHAPQLMSCNYYVHADMSPYSLVQVYKTGSYQGEIPDIHR